MILDKFVFSFTFGLGKQNKTDFSFISLILFRMCFFGAAQGWGGWSKKPPPSLSKFCCTYLTIMKLGAVIPYLKDIKKIYGSRDTA